MHLLESVKVRDALGIDLCTAVRAFRVGCILIAIPNGIGWVCYPGKTIRAGIMSAWDEDSWVRNGIVAYRALKIASRKFYAFDYLRIQCPGQFQ